MPKVDWNAPGLYYLLKYRQVPGGQFGDPEKITDPLLTFLRYQIPVIISCGNFRFKLGTRKVQGLRVL